MTETWRLVDIEFPDDPFMNLAVEEAIPRMVGSGEVRNTVRFWHNSNTIVLGCFQSAKLEVNFEASKELGTNIVRRFTGGGAVYHDQGNLNYAISLHRGHRLVPGSDLQQAFETLSMGAVNGLQALGVKAGFQPINDIQVNGLKVSGAAGSIRWDTVFHHGCILVGSDLSILAKVLNVPQVKLADKHVASVRKRVTTISSELGRQVSTTEVKNSISKGIEVAYNVKLERDDLTRGELELARELYDEKYSRPEWNLAR
ncbi:MAG TPA: biotin/lipoate A/B protein ligase family protein [Candidatus Binatus sp.]|jgi:lipoate-protein ligase A|nr:biotin/lipoate A/B protein ligase family protein [Candidatus Binatus sp.]